MLYSDDEKTSLNNKSSTFVLSDTITNIIRQINYVQHAKHVFVITITIIHILYFVAFFGFFIIDEKYIHYLNIFIQVFVVLFLIVRFHPYKTIYSITQSDKTIVFGSAILLGTNLVTVEFANWIPYAFGKNISEKIRDRILHFLS